MRDGTGIFQIVMGRRFYEHDFPELIKAVNRLADAVEKNNALTALKEQGENNTSAKI